MVMERLLSRHSLCHLSKPQIVLKPNDRWCIIAKTRAGKTFLTLVMLSIVLPFEWPNRTLWQVWWIDTKGEQKDLARLSKWGFLDAQKAPKNYPRVLFKVRSIDPTDEQSVAKQVQAICWSAFKRKPRGRKNEYPNVLIVIDEYVSVIMSSRNAGPGLVEVFQRGGGKHVGLMGETQAPVGIPRELASQATFIILGRLTHKNDLEWAADLCPQYVVRGPDGLEANIPDPYGFWFKWVDGPPSLSRWKYFPDIAAFRELFDLQEEKSA